MLDKQGRSQTFAFGGHTEGAGKQFWTIIGGTKEIRHFNSKQ